MSSNNRLLLADYLQGQGNFGRNYIQNTSGFRNATKGITASGATVTRNTTTPLTAISDIQIELDAATDYAEFATNSLDRSLSGQACEMTADYKLTLGSGATVQAQVLINGTTVHSTDLVATTTVNKVSLIYPCGDLSTSTTVRFAQTVAATTSTLNVANVYLGATKNIGTVAQARSVVKMYRASSNQAIASSSATKVQFNATSFDYLGGADTTTNYRYTIKQPGDYTITTTVAVVNVTAERNEALIYKNGAPACDGGQTTNTSTNFIINACTLSLATNDYIEVYVDSQSDTGYDVVSGVENTRLEITRFPTASETVARLDAPGVTLTSYTPPTTLGFGTTTSNDFQYQCIAPNLLYITASFTSGTVDGSQARIGLPTSFTIGMSTSKKVQVGNLTRAGSAGPITVMATQGLTYVTFGAGASSQGDVVGSSLVGSTEALKMNAYIPVTDVSPCSKSPQVLIPGSVYSSSSGVERVERVQVSGASSNTACTSTPCVVQSQSGSVSSVTRSGTGTYAVNFSTGTFSAAPTCTCSSTRPGIGPATCSQIENPSAASSGFTSHNNGTAVDGWLSITCQGPR